MQKLLCYVKDKRFIIIFVIVAFKDQERRTPLHAAAWLGDVHIMDLLITAGEYSFSISKDPSTYLLTHHSITVVFVFFFRSER